MENEKVLNEVLEELDKELLNSELIKDNKLHFKIDDILYRVRMPNQKELAEAGSKKHEFYIELIQTPNTIHKKKLIEILKEKQNIDINVMQKEANELEKQLIDLYLSLARKKDTEINAIDKIKIQIEEVKNKRMKVIIEMAGYLSSSIESQISEKYMRYLTAVCTEKYIQKDEKGYWQPVWKNFVEYLEDDSKISLKAIGVATNLIFST